jgi:general secretion pathway protein G
METQDIKNTKRDRGFTLVELLIVIVILGVLATVTVFAVSGITDRGNQSACKADVKTVEVAVEAYYAEKGSYPTDATAQLGGGKYVRTMPSHVSVNSTTGAVSSSKTPC